MAIDGHFGLRRKKSAGQSVRPPLYNGVYFEDQAKVDTFVESYKAGHAATTKVNDKDGDVLSRVACFILRSVVNF